MPKSIVVHTVQLAGTAAERLSVRGREGSLAILYLHGGAYILGHPRLSRSLTSRLAHRLDADVYAIRYRLAPEHPFPNALEDAVAAFHALNSNARFTGRVVVVGESAGGGLALATAVSLRDTSAIRPLGLVCLSPWVDLEMREHQSHVSADDFLSQAALKRGALMYLAGQSPRSLASPVYADLRNLPPTQIFVAKNEVLHDDGMRVAAALQEAKVEVELHEEGDLFHMWPVFAGKIPEADRSLEQIVRFISDLLHRVASGR